MNILMLNYEYPPLGGGGAPAARDLAAELVSQGNKVDVVTMSFKTLKRRELDAGVTVYRVPSIRRHQSRSGVLEMASYLISSIIFAARLVKRERYDIIHTHFIFPTGLVSAVLKSFTGLPVLITAHGSDVPGYNPDRFRLLHLLLKPFWLLVANSADLITTPSSFLKTLVEKNLRSKVMVIPNGFKPPYFDEDKKGKKILVATRLFKRKGVQYLIGALKRIETDWEVNIAGDGPYLPVLKKMASSAGCRVNFLGFVKGERLKNLYETSSIFVFPSVREDFPMVLLEAMSAGCAILTTEAAGIPEVVGEAALKVACADENQIAGALQRMLADKSLRRALGEEAKERVKEFEIGIIARRFFSLYENLTNGKKA